MHPAVLERFRREDEAVLLRLQKEYNAELHFVASPACHMESFVIQNAESGEELYRAVPPEAG